MRVLILVLLLAGCGDPTLALGDAVDGALTPDDTEIHPGAVVDVLRVRLEAGERAAILVTSDALAPFVVVASPGEPWGAAWGSASGTGACMTVGSDDALELVVHVSSAEADGFGAYQLAVKPFTHALAAAHGCRVGGPHGHPPIPGPSPTLTVTAGANSGLSARSRTR